MVASILGILAAMVRHATRIRLDELLVQRGLAPSRHQARALVLAGRVRAAGAAHLKPGLMVVESAVLDVAPSPAFVSRGGLKLAHGLAHFGVDPSGRIGADIGASTGGFTDCLLKGGATRVYAIDVGYGQLDWRLRNDPRVVVMERTNARYLERLPDIVDLVVVDVSFISLRLLLAAVARIAEPAADLIALVKPQFEAGRDRVGKGGVVRDAAVHREVLVACAAWTREAGFGLQGLTASPIRGPAGNVEFLAHLQVGVSAGSDAADVGDLISKALGEASLVA